MGYEHVRRSLADDGQSSVSVGSNEEIDGHGNITFKPDCGRIRGQPYGVIIWVALFAQNLRIQP